MAQRKTYSQMQREAARAQEAARRQAERAQAAYARAQAAEEKERKRLYAEKRAADVAAANADLEATIESFQNLLSAALGADDPITFTAMKLPAVKPEWKYAHLETPQPAPTREQFIPPPPGGIVKLFLKAKYEQMVAEGQTKYALAVRQHDAQEVERKAKLEKLRENWRAEAFRLEQEAQRQHQQIDALEAAYLRGDAEAIAAYCKTVLETAYLPEGIDLPFKLVYAADSRQIVVECDLPSVDVIPTVRSYKYVKTSDSVNESPRPQSQIKSLYSSIVSQIALSTIHHLFASDSGGHIDTIVLNGMIDTINRASGHRVRPCLISVRTTRDVFNQIALSNVDPAACLKHLSASVSKDPAELVPVRPVVEFNMFDPRFVEESDAMSHLNARQNLMELTPTEFETLIQNLFTKMGLEARQTRASRDGGVDCVAWDPRPIFGGKVVIQAKRYKNTVSVSAVRDLFGTLQNEGASKGILVTTSGYGQASFEFAKNKPIELLDGPNLLSLLAEHAGIEAKIIPPEDWRDPVADSPGYGD